MKLLVGMAPLLFRVTRLAYRMVRFHPYVADSATFLGLFWKSYCGIWRPWKMVGPDSTGREAR